MNRRPIMAANWKMHMATASAESFAEAFMHEIGPDAGAEIVIAPPAGLLGVMRRALAGRPDILLAAQNVHWEPKGAFTGEMSAELAADLGCGYVIVGHSERRSLFGETDAQVAEKVGAVLRAHLRPIVCVGESLEERENGRTLDTVRRQLETGLAELTPDTLASLVVAYEPVWAIGTGRTATPDIAQEVHAFIRERLGDRFGDAGRDVRIQYGGSVKADNVEDILAEPDIDGALVGGASLSAEDFASIVRASDGTGAQEFES